MCKMCKDRKCSFWSVGRIGCSRYHGYDIGGIKEQVRDQIAQAELF